MNEIKTQNTGTLCNLIINFAQHPSEQGKRNALKLLFVMDNLILFTQPSNPSDNNLPDLPGYANIPGNKYADQAIKAVCLYPSTTFIRYQTVSTVHSKPPNIQMSKMAKLPSI